MIDFFHIFFAYTDIFSTVVNIWNSLSDCLVQAASRQLDKYQINQGVGFNCKSELAETGKRSS